MAQSQCAEAPRVMTLDRAQSAGRMATLRVHPTGRAMARSRSSANGAAGTDAIDFSELAPAVSHGALLGYQMLQVAGREPLLYRPLGRLLDVAKQSGMLTGVTTNGLVVCPATVKVLAGRCDVVTLSVSTPGTEFSAVLSELGRRVAMLTEAGLLVNLEVTLTGYNVGDLGTVVSWANEQGIRSIRLQPRKVSSTTFQQVMAEQTGSGIALDVDALMPLRLQEHSQWFLGPDDLETLSLARIIDPLLILADGAVVPLAADLDDRYRLGSLRDGALTTLARRWRQEGATRLAQLRRETYRMCMHPSVPAFASWTEELTRRSKLAS